MGEASVDQLAILAEVALAMLLGGLIGWEREAADKPAGLRTHMLVAGAAALLVGLGDTLLLHYRGEMRDLVNTDPIRIMGAVITGVSFLGAGTIFRNHEGTGIQGLTTAAGLLMAATVGIAVALRQHLLAISVTLLILLVLYVVQALERRIACWRRSRQPSSPSTAAMPDTTDEQPQRKRQIDPT
ncbi:MgtC/SapB family protein [Chitiniphilus purpureus]|uniref:Protein MgtC n=1 Tax=Chitiniphilus purpureus TaxID=2981137 RepID=A0ABY6DLV6_9NEIS|nr:MgtC/SapB family protein [Chitiniphilus sp. CD1]UXY15355.1 MgtC/SapB family protein [Chitiniphilus sp. CD1]